MEDATTASGNRVNIPVGGLPINSSDVPIDPTAWNRNDGFSANALAADVRRRPRPDEPADMDRHRRVLEDDATVVLVDTASGERIPLWAEPDAGSVDYPDEQLLVIHPAVSLEPATTYVVGLQGLLDHGRCSRSSVSPVFEVYRDNLTTDDRHDRGAPRRDGDRFAALEVRRRRPRRPAARVDVHHRQRREHDDRDLQIRDETMAALGDSTPEFPITAVNEAPEVTRSPGSSRAPTASRTT